MSQQNFFFFLKFISIFYNFSVIQWEISFGTVAFTSYIPFLLFQELWSCRSFSILELNIFALCFRFGTTCLDIFLPFRNCFCHIYLMFQYLFIFLLVMAFCTDGYECLVVLRDFYKFYKLATNPAIFSFNYLHCFYFFRAHFFAVISTLLK